MKNGKSGTHSREVNSDNNVHTTAKGHGPSWDWSGGVGIEVVVMGGAAGVDVSFTGFGVGVGTKEVVLRASLLGGLVE
jgi:hypothetical protein